MLTGQVVGSISFHPPYALRGKREIMAAKLTCSPDDIKVISPQEARALLDSDAKGDYILLDVRQPEEYWDIHIPGAKLIPLAELEQRQGELDRDKKIITYCRSGRRSMGASVILCGLGFKDVLNIRGGISDWHYEMVTGPPEEGMWLAAGLVAPKEALLLAFRLEKGSQDFYAQAERRLRGKTKLLPRLLDAEQQHMKRIYAELARHWEGAVPALDELKRQVSADHTEAGLTVDEALLRFDGEFKDDLEVMEVALEMESKAYDLYKRMASAAAEQRLREVFLRLADAERGHIRELSGELKRFL
jgi:rhodanese-related sulfurtransferase/rubrerythrin